MCAKRYCMPDPTVAMTDEVIMAQIPAGSRVVDLGCGDGRLLEKLRDNHRCSSIHGIELDLQHIFSAVARGVPVIQADLDKGLSDIPDRAFDFAVLSQTLQQVERPPAILREMLRIASRALVVVPNFGHWRVRRQLVFQGRVPVTSALPYEWYESPNRHFMTMHDFRYLVERIHLRIVKELPIIRDKAVDHAWAANLRADSALYVLERSAGSPHPPRR